MMRILLDHMESFQKEVGNSDIKEFASYLNDKVKYGDQGPENHFDKNNYQNYKSYMEIEFATLLTGLFRFAKHYSKKCFTNTSIKTLDEFGFLSTLLREKNLSKQELMGRHLIETSSGSEIIKRLIKNKLVYEFPDENDRRSKRVALTQEGIAEIMSSFDSMHKASKIIIGNLNPDELKEALAIFNKLTYFHNHIHEVDKQTEIDALYSKYVETN